MKVGSHFYFVFLSISLISPRLGLAQGQNPDPFDLQNSNTSCSLSSALDLFSNTNLPQLANEFQECSPTKNELNYTNLAICNCIKERKLSKLSDSDPYGIEQVNPLTLSIIKKNYSKAVKKQLTKKWIDEVGLAMKSVAQTSSMLKNLSGFNTRDIRQRFQNDPKSIFPSCFNLDPYQLVNNYLKKNQSCKNKLKDKEAIDEAILKTFNHNEFALPLVGRTDLNGIFNPPEANGTGSLIAPPAGELLQTILVSLTNLHSNESIINHSIGKTDICLSRAMAQDLDTLHNANDFFDLLTQDEGQLFEDLKNLESLMKLEKNSTLSPAEVFQNYKEEILNGIDSSHFQCPLTPLAHPEPKSLISLASDVSIDGRIDLNGINFCNTSIFTENSILEKSAKRPLLSYLLKDPMLFKNVMKIFSDPENQKLMNEKSNDPYENSINRLKLFKKAFLDHENLNQLLSSINKRCEDTYNNSLGTLLCLDENDPSEEMVGFNNFPSFKELLKEEAPNPGDEAIYLKLYCQNIDRYGTLPEKTLAKELSEGLSDGLIEKTDLYYEGNYTPNDENSEKELEKSNFVSLNKKYCPFLINHDCGKETCEPYYKDPRDLWETSECNLPIARTSTKCVGLYELMANKIALRAPPAPGDDRPYAYFIDKDNKVVIPREVITLRKALICPESLDSARNRPPFCKEQDSNLNEQDTFAIVLDGNVERPEPVTPLLPTQPGSSNNNNDVLNLYAHLNPTKDNTQYFYNNIVNKPLAPIHASSDNSARSSDRTPQLPSSPLAAYTNPTGNQTTAPLHTTLPVTTNSNNPELTLPPATTASRAPIENSRGPIAAPTNYTVPSDKDEGRSSITSISQTQSPQIVGTRPTQRETETTTFSSGRYQAESLNTTTPLFPLATPTVLATATATPDPQLVSLQNEVRQLREELQRKEEKKKKDEEKVETIVDNSSEQGPSVEEIRKIAQLQEEILAQNKAIEERKQLLARKEQEARDLQNQLFLNRSQSLTTQSGQYGGQNNSNTSPNYFPNQDNLLAPVQNINIPSGNAPGPTTIDKNNDTSPVSVTGPATTEQSARDQRAALREREGVTQGETSTKSSDNDTRSSVQNSTEANGVATLPTRDFSGGLVLTVNGSNSVVSIGELQTLVRSRSFRSDIPISVNGLHFIKESDNSFYLCDENKVKTSQDPLTFDQLLEKVSHSPTLNNIPSPTEVSAQNQIPSSSPQRNPAQEGQEPIREGVLSGALDSFLNFFKRDKKN